MPVHDLIAFVQQNYSSRHGVPTSRSRPSDYTGEPVYDEVDIPQEEGERPLPPDWLENADVGSLVSISGTERIALEGHTSNLELEPMPRAEQAVDTLAYYRPFHSYRSTWGIYLKASGIVHVAGILKGGPVTSADNSLVELSRKILFEHEFFHFVSEIACSRAEVATKKALYERYFNHRYAAPHEEALANRHAYQKALTGQLASLKSVVITWMKRQPNGYRDFHYWISRRRFEHGCRRAVNYMLQPVPAQLPSGLIGPAEFLFSLPRTSSVRTRMLIDLTSVRILKPFPKFAGMRVVVHTNDHVPPHFHVERPIGADVTRCLWPDLKPYPGDKHLSASEEKDLRAYLDRFGKKIDRKIRTVYRLA